MKALHTLSLFILLASSASLLIACSGGGTPTTPATTAPTVVQATVPPTQAPTATSAPTNPAAVMSDADADKTVRGAFAKYQTAKTFRLDAHAQLSPVFFQANYTPGPGDDPNIVMLFTIKGEQRGADSHYALNGFMASFIGLMSGFDPNSQALEVTQVNGTLYMRGKLENETQARWYSIPADQASSMRFAPQDLIAPLTKTTYPDGAFSKTGSETLGNQTCNVFTGNRAAFDAAFPQIEQLALLNTDTLELSTIDRAEFKIWVCADGSVYRTQYDFDAHAKTQADKKGSFAFTVNVADYDADISIQAPDGAVPLSGSPLNTGPTPEPTETTSAAATTTFADPEGEWEGKSETGSPIAFTVTNNSVTFASLNYSINSGGCSLGGAYSANVDDGAIRDQNFSFVMTDSDGVQYTFTGKLNSNNDAAGSLEIKGKTFCGDTDYKATWTAKHISSPGGQPQNVGPTDEPTAEPTDQAAVEPTAEPTDQAAVEPTPADSSNVGAAEIVTMAFHSFADKDVDGALQYFDENVVYNIGTTNGIGTASLKSYMQLAIAAGGSFQISNLQDLGNVVTLTVKVTGLGAGTYSNSSAIVQDGKIMIFTVK